MPWVNRDVMIKYDHEDASKQVSEEMATACIIANKAILKMVNS